MIYERNTGTMIYARNPDMKIDPNSMVKMMTALVAIENGDLTQTVTVTRSALSELPIGTVTANLQRGEELTLEQLLYCLMAASANDAALVIAEHIAGSQAAFVGMMNEKAAQLGCTDTVFTNAHGLSDPNMYSTVRDICRLTDAALENEVFRTLFCAESYQIPATNKSEAREILTSNNMRRTSNKKYYDPRVTGGKTGASNQGRCLVATAEGSGMELLTIIMDATPTYEGDTNNLSAYGSFEETKVLLDYALGTYEYRQLFYEGQIITQYPVAGGENSAVVQPGWTGGTILPRNLDKSQLNWVYGDPGELNAPIQKGQSISTLQIWYGNKCLAQTELVAVNAVAAWKEPTQQPRVEIESELGVLEITGFVVMGVAALGVLTVAVLIVVHFVRGAKHNNRRRNR